MRKTLVLILAAFLSGCASAPIALRDMGSFHVGELTGVTYKTTS